MSSLIRIACAAVLAGLAAMPVPAPAGAQDAPPQKEQFTAEAVFMGRVATGRTTRMNFTFNRWTTDAELGELRTALVENGTEGLFKALTRMKPVGRIRRDTGGVGWELRYARDMRGAGKRRIVGGVGHAGLDLGDL